MATVDTPNSLTLSVTVPSSAFTLNGFRKWHYSDDYPKRVRISFIDGELFIEFTPDVGVRVPRTANTLDGFRDWAYSPHYPKRGRITFVDGRLYIDMSPERYELHLAVKSALNRTLDPMVDAEGLGVFYPDGAWITNVAAELSTEPDAAFASWATLESGRFAPPAGKASDDRYTEMSGAPDWVCEVVSDSSEVKDLDALITKYHRAGVREYWLIDARGDEIDFQLLVGTPEGFQSVEACDDWFASPVFGREFQLTRQRDRVGRWKYALRHRNP